jgi:hypothetical protein
MKRLSMLILAFSLPLLGAGCGGDSAPSGPVAKCEALLNAICGRFVGCGVLSSMSSCVQTFSETLDCRKATGISPGYDTCMSDITGASCDTVRQSSSLPSSCKGTVYFP